MWNLGYELNPRVRCAFGNVCFEGSIDVTLDYKAAYSKVIDVAADV